MKSKGDKLIKSANIYWWFGLIIVLLCVGFITSMIVSNQILINKNWDIINNNDKCINLKFNGNYNDYCDCIKTSISMMDSAGYRERIDKFNDIILGFDAIKSNQC